MVSGVREQVFPAPGWARLLLGAICAGLLAAALWWNGAFLCGWQRKTLQADLDGDGSLEELRLSGQRLSVVGKDALLWRTEAGWRVQDFLVGDVDRDGDPELLLLVWKRGSYGDSHPFWEEAADWRFSQHIFIYRWRDGEMQALWMSSRLRPEVERWDLEGGRIRIRTPEGLDTLWGWRSWGLERLDGGRIAY